MEELNIIEKVTEEILEVDNAVVICEREIIEDLIDELEDCGYVIDNYDELFIELEDCDVLALNKCGDEFYIEYPFDENDELECYCNNDLAIVQVGILFDEELEELEEATNGELYVFELLDDDIEDCSFEDGTEDSEYEEDDELDEFLENEAQDFIELLVKNNEENNFCPYCELKQLLKEIYDLGYTDGRNDIALGLSDMLNDIVEED